MARPKVLVSGIEEDQLGKLQEKCDVTVGPEEITSETILWYQNNIKEYDGLIASKLPVDSKLIDAGENLKIISGRGVGYDHIDAKYAAEKGIIVSNCPNSVMQPTAEMAFTMLLSLTRRVHFYDSNMRQGIFLNTDLVKNQGQSPVGKTLGIFGMGRIGQTLAKYASAFGMNILYHNRHRLPEEIERNLSADYVSFETLLKQSDYVSLHAPATRETYHIMDESAFSIMQNGAFLINTSRGSLVDEQALLKALKTNKLAGAGLDVFENEPHCNPEFYKLDNVILTPHAGSATQESRRGVVVEAIHNILSFLIDGIPVNRVN